MELREERRDIEERELREKIRKRREDKNEKIEDRREKIKERRNKRKEIRELEERREGTRLSCSTSPSGGNQVDGLPPV